MQGKTINGYTLKHLLGKGGMAEVWYAENSLGKKAAVKFLKKELSANEDIVERFRNEAKVMVSLDHPNIRQVYDYAEMDGQPAIIMEYLEGDDLKTWIKRGRHFADDELVKLWNDTVDALNYTHKQGVVHRDIKPSNIFITNKGVVKILDFGIAKIKEATSGTKTGSTLGTLIYMSPEQIKDPKRVDYRTDVYSLAVSFVHLLTGKAPYDTTNSSDFDIQMNIVQTPLDTSALSKEWQNMLQPYLVKDSQQRGELRVFAMNNDEEETVVGKSMKNKAEQPASQKVIHEPVPNKGLSKGLVFGLFGVALAIGLALGLCLKPGKSLEKENISVESSIVSYDDSIVQPVEQNVVDDTFEDACAKVFAESSNVVSGQRYKAQAMLPLMLNKNIKAKIRLDGGTEKVYECDETGVIDFDFICGVGTHKYSGYIEMQEPKTGGMKQFPFENKFTVSSPSVSVSATKTNVVYAGIDNPISVAAGGSGNLSVTATGATLKKTGEGIYNLKVTPGSQKVSVHVSSDGLNSTVDFRVKDLPKPTAFIRNVGADGRVSKDALLAANRVEAEMKDFDFEGVHYDVTGYTMKYRTKAGTTKEAKVTGPTFNDECKNAISRANVGDMFVFTSIQVKGNDGKTKVLDCQLAVEIK